MTCSQRIFFILRNLSGWLYKDVSVLFLHVYTDKCAGYTRFAVIDGSRLSSHRVYQSRHENELKWTEPL